MLSVKLKRDDGFHLDLEDYLMGLLQLASELVSPDIVVHINTLCIIHIYMVTLIAALQLMLLWHTMSITQLSFELSFCN